MSSVLNKLTARQVEAAKFEGQSRKLADGGGLYLLVNKAGKYWRLKYRYHRKEKSLSLGTYPQVSLSTARTRRDEAKALLEQGIDPSARRKEEKAIQEGATFKEVAAEWLEKQRPRLAETTQGKARWLLSLLYPRIGSHPIAELKAPDVLSALRRIEERGNHETAHRAKQKAGQVFRYAIATGQAERDPTADLRGALTPPKEKNRAALTRPDDIAGLLRAIEGYQGNVTTKSALQLSAFLFVRPGELRRMEWKELDLESRQWRIPGRKMKMGEEHIVPLPDQAVAILQHLEQINGHSDYVFPSIRTASRPMSENTITGALRRLGYGGEEMTAHGFRAMASTRLNELGWDPELIERQLAHEERNKVKASYNRAQYLERRHEMMQGWADYLEALRVGETNG